MRKVSLSSSASIHPKVPDAKDEKATNIYKQYRPEKVTPQQRGIEILRTPRINKGMVFSLYERQYLGIHGLLPPAFESQDLQVVRIITRIREAPNDLARYSILDSLQERNEKLFYRVLSDYILELVPIVYTPTVGLACQEFGHIYKAPKGVYVTINDNSVSQIYQILSNWPTTNVKAIVVSDGERILGLGDLGCYGMGIPIGKMALYVALAGVHPEWCLPVLIDAGTDNKKLLDDPFYTGLRRNRVRGEKYDELIDNFMQAVVKKFGIETLIQFEDFANRNAYRFLEKYQNKYCMFNDDIQGTAAVVVAGLLATTRITKKKLSEEKFLFFGAGTAALGVAELCIMQMKSEGLTEEEACKRIYFMNSKGLLTKERENILTDQQKKFAKNQPTITSLLEVVKTVKPGAIIGLSTVGGAFSKEVIEEMAANNPRPIIFALSNPTDKSECTAEQAYKFTNGKALYASGSPFPDVTLDGKLLKPGQGNNSYIFPGVALGVILFKIRHVDNEFFLQAARVVAETVDREDLEKFSKMYPNLENIRELSIKIAVAVGELGYKKGLAQLYPEPEEKEVFVRYQVYTVDYEEIINKPYEWPEEDKKGSIPAPILEK